MNIKGLIEETFSVESISFSERIKIVEIAFETYFLPTSDKIEEILTAVNQRDNLKISLTNPDEENIIIINNDVQFDAAYSEFIHNMQPNDIIKVNLEIIKKISVMHLSIYNWTAFLDDLNSKDLLMIMSVFSKLMRESQKLIFEIFDENIYWNTRTMIFTNNANVIYNAEINRIERIGFCKDTSYFYTTSEINIIPDDFIIITDYQDNPLTEVFAKIATILSVAYISTVSSLEQNKLKIQIAGQRNVNFIYDLEDVKYNKELVKIYDWIYTDGNAVDKAIIARNIISLHCKYSNLIEIDEKTFSSIQSNYKMYLKDNAVQYLEAKNKVSELICDIIAKVGDDVIQLLIGFKSNIFAIFGFILTVVIINVTSTKPLDNIFTQDVTIILEIILGGSLVYFIICLFESIYKYGKNKRAYTVLKNNYKDIFSEEDFRNVFDADKEFMKARKTVKFGMYLYSGLWICAIVVMLIVVENLSDNLIFLPWFCKILSWFCKK